MPEKIIVDGYNLIGTYHRDLKAQRTKLIHDLSSYKRRKGVEMTVVFDGIRDGFNKTRQVTAGITVIYSGRGESADDVIKELISHAAVKYIVVTSDRAIASFAWVKNCVPVSSEAFSRKLYSETDTAEAMYPGDDDDDFDKTTTANKKGNPRILSKKDRMLRQALDKL
ncbi:MAG: NYN domain-containing protein [Nitrospirae bacterium]|nr:NYN domain-containing protein [Nitrospirota bacterium]